MEINMGGRISLMTRDDLGFSSLIQVVDILTDPAFQISLFMASIYVLFSVLLVACLRTNTLEIRCFIP
jgi:hypothetical protein